MGIEQMPDINKIRKEIDEKNAEMEKKERERIEEEYKRLSEQEKPTEEPKKEEPEEKKKEGAEKGIKDENIIQKLTPENVKAAAIFKAAYEKGKFIEVKVKRSSGEIEDGWVISNINPKTGEATVLKFTSEKGKDRSFVDKIVTLEELREWNKPETKESEEKKEKKEEVEVKKEVKEEPKTKKVKEGAKKDIRKKTEKKEEPKEKKGEKEKQKEDLEKEITEREKEISERYYEELEKIKDMPDKTERLKMEKTKKYFQLIENWQNSAYSDNYEGVQKVFTELDKLKPPIFPYILKKARMTNNVAKSMALNYKEWKLEDKEKLKIIKNFVSKEKNIFYSKDKNLKEIAQILASKDIPYKNNIDIIVKEIKNPDIKAETIAGMADIEKQSIKEKEEHLQALKEDMKRDKLPPDEIIIEQLEKLGVDPKAASEILSRLFGALENPEVQKEFEELKNTKEFQAFRKTIEKVIKEKGEIPEDLKKVKEYIKDEKKESVWGTGFGTIGQIILVSLVLLLLALLEGVHYLAGLAGGKKKDKK